METELLRIARRALEHPKEKFTSLMKRVTDPEVLRASYESLPGRKAPGIDGIDKKQYGEALPENITDLSERLRRMAYRPQAVRRVYAFPGLRPEKWPLRGSPVGAGSVRRFRAGDRAPSYKRPRDRQQIVDAHPVRAYAFPGLRPEKWPLRGSPVGAGSVRRFRAGDRAPSYKRPRDRQQIVDAHPVRAYAFPGLRPEKWPLRGSPVGAGSVRRFRAGDRAPSYKRPRDRQQIVDAHPVRAYIPKLNGGTRPLGIPAFEDRIVQDRVAAVLSAIWESEFRACSFGFRPQRSAHGALEALHKAFMQEKMQYLVEADIKGFFNHVNHEKLMQCIDLRIADPRFKRLIRRFLKAGVLEDGIFAATEEGTPQGGLITPPTMLQNPP